MKDSNEPRGLRTPEFWLVVIMLGIMSILVMAVLWLPITMISTDKPTAKAILDFRRTILSIIITAFGAWVGAGAAYYFGRENLRQSTNSLLQMRDLSGRELLRQTRVSQIPPRKIPLTAKTSDKLDQVLGRLRDDPKLWFIPIVKKGGTLETVIHEEGIWRFVDAQMVALKKPKTPEQINEMKMSDVLTFIKADEKLKERAFEIHVKVTPDNTAELANEMMESKKVYLGIICDDKKRPTHYIEADDLRLLLAHSGQLQRPPGAAD